MKRTSGPRVELTRLVKTIGEIEGQFLAPYLVPATMAPASPEESLNVAAYVVLVHGALENFVEGLALWMLGKIVSNWRSRLKAGRSTAALLLYQEIPATNKTTVFENLKDALESAKSSHSKVIQQNHGVSPRHLTELFSPLGLNIPTDPQLIGSLDLVVNLRHQWAHRYRHSPQIERSASDVKVAVDDCIKLAQKLAANAAVLKL